MTISTAPQANTYAMRMFNDDYWTKEYTPHLDQLTSVKSNQNDPHFTFPATLQVYRHCIGDDDAENYLDLYPDGVVPDHVPNDEGVITLKLIMRINENLDGFDEKVQHCLNVADCSSLGLHVEGSALATMEPDLTLSMEATEHLINAINKQYMCVDMLSDLLDLPNQLLRAMR